MLTNLKDSPTKKKKDEKKEKLSNVYMSSKDGG